MIEEYIFSGKRYLKSYITSYFIESENLLSIEAIENWILVNGSDYLILLYTYNFYYFAQFITEYFKDLLESEWKISLLENCAEIDQPAEKILQSFVALRDEYSTRTLFKFGIPKIYFYYNYYIGYQLDDKIAMVKKLF